MEQEIIICSAVRAKDGYIYRGHRHFDALRGLQGMPRYIGERPYGDDQGFITSRNRYVNRAEAFQIHTAAGLPSADKENPFALRRELLSEDLY